MKKRPSLAAAVVVNDDNVSAVALALAMALAAPVQRLPGRVGRMVVPLLACGGISVAAGSLAGLFVSEISGPFGFLESGCRSALVISIVLEAATVVLFAAYTGLSHGGAP